MAEVKESLEVNVPVETAYNQWTQFEEFPQFMENVESVTQLDDTHLRWVASDRAVKVDLERFKDLIEKRGVETGAWRGEVVEGERVD
jgi:uncharacterized membrane protein